MELTIIFKKDSMSEVMKVIAPIKGAGVETETQSFENRVQIKAKSSNGLLHVAIAALNKKQITFVGGFKDFDHENNQESYDFAAHEGDLHFIPIHHRLGYVIQIDAQLGIDLDEPARFFSIRAAAYAELGIE